jgi:hypothetical protein
MEGRVIQGGDRLYDVLALFDFRDDSYTGHLVKAAREGWERSAMGEPNAWREFDEQWNDAPSEDRVRFALEYCEENANRA